MNDPAVQFVRDHAHSRFTATDLTVIAERLKQQMQYNLEIGDRGPQSDDETDEEGRRWQWNDIQKIYYVIDAESGVKQGEWNNGVFTNYNDGGQYDWATGEPITQKGKSRGRGKSKGKGKSQRQASRTPPPSQRRWQYSSSHHQQPQQEAELWRQTHWPNTTQPVPHSWYRVTGQYTGLKCDWCKERYYDRGGRCHNRGCPGPFHVWAKAENRYEDYPRWKEKKSR